ncbi:hypothetical protein LNP00_06370 [Fructobacillus sp. M158]|uniref:hypothetical protein n=1 Tax=Fructobacillus parabroussonetiae TaxID=2713174 RepID=UPI00200B2C4D|nr:hypothetical protein [Fructobacillus parabroussonetiae]MCK8617977.1 hypothetical protein [Fructobacillus parabroussonetiae]
MKKLILFLAALLTVACIGGISIYAIPFFWRGSTQLENTRNIIKQLDEKMDQQRNKSQELTNEKSDYMKKITASEKKIDMLNQAIFDQQTNLIDIVNQKDSEKKIIANQLVEKQMQLEAEKENYKKKQHELDLINEDISKLNNEIKINKQKIDELNNNVKDLKNENSALKQELNYALQDAKDTESYAIRVLDKQNKLGF